MQTAAMVGVPLLALELEEQGMVDDEEEALKKATRMRPRVLASADGDRLDLAACMRSVEDVADDILAMSEQVLTEAEALALAARVRAEVLEEGEAKIGELEREGDEDERG